MKKEWIFLAFWLVVSSFAVLNLQDRNGKKPVQAGSKQSQKSATAQYMEKQGLVDIKSVDPTIKVALMYARTDNFCHKLLYTNLREAYALPQCAAALKKAQAELKRLRPDLSTSFSMRHAQ